MERRPAFWLARATAAGALLSSCLSLPAVAQQSVDAARSAAPATVTFRGSVGAILRKHCVECHRPGGIAPFSLATFDAAQPRAEAIARAVVRRQMPPWKPEPGKGRFIGERLLNDEEIEQLRTWASVGAPEGRTGSLAPWLPPTDEWRLGQPDLIVAMPTPYDLRPGLADVFRTFVLPIRLKEPRYVRALEFQPGHAHVVHHANLGIDRSGSARRLDARDPEPGYSGGMVPDAVPEGQLLGWTPGQTPREVPSGLSWRIEPGSDLVAQVHLRPSEHAAHVQIRVGLYFSTDPPSRTPLSLRLGSQIMDIPAGVREYVVSDTYTLPVDVDVMAVQPHAHYLGRTMEAYAEKPGGATEWLISIREWDFNWQDVYRYAEPVSLPHGTRIVMRYTYDNSATNPRNPHRPPRRVLWGQSTTDEMGDLWLQVVPRTSRDASVLRNDFAEKAFNDDVEAYTTLARAEPFNPLRRDVLGGLFLQAGRLQESVVEFRASLDANPDSAPTRYNLGLALSRLGLREEATAEFEHALRIDPEHGEAHNNLGVMLFATGRRDEALAHVARGAELRPGNANAQTNLGQMLSAMGKDAEAVAAFRRALTVDSSWVPALNGLAWVLATSSNDPLRAPVEAVVLAERAAAATASNDPVVLNVLAASYAAANRWDDAVVVARKAADLAASQQRPDLEAEIRNRLAHYVERRRSTAEQP